MEYSSSRYLNELSLDRFNPFVPNALFLYPLKISENSKVFFCFPGVEKGCIGNEWVKEFVKHGYILTALVDMIRHI